MAKSAKTKHEDLGRMLVNVYESGYLDKNQAYKQSFIKGLVSGFGGVIGATIGIALLIWILTLFIKAPVVGPLFDNLKHSIQKKQP